MSEFRVGYGEDIHRLVRGRKLILAGIAIPFRKGLLGHSDADVVFHAVSDAILGALALGDIGKLFPSSDPATEGMDSALIVRKCLSLAQEKGYKVNNADVSVALEEPRLAPHIAAMRASLAKALGAEEGAVSIKAMTNEGLDAVGHGRAIRATAIVTLGKDEKTHGQ
jgi:2-C-methyl-D-erythritol 2,4-cyclodiphosphate synthase